MQKSQMSKKIGEDAERQDVTIIGDVFCDIMTMPIRGYPEKDKKSGCEFIFSIGGQAGYCAAACTSLGLKTSIICKTGNDLFSKWILSELQKFCVHCFTAKSEKGEHQRPGITVSICFEDGNRSMLSDRGTNTYLKIEDIDFELLRKTKFVMRAGHWNTEGLFSSNEKILSFAKSIGAYTGVDIGWSAFLGWTTFARETVFDFLPSTDFLFVNESEIKGLSGKESGGEYELLDRGCKNVIIHKGEKGSAWVSRDFEMSCPAFKVKPIRPTGAGDVFNAGFIYAFLAGKEGKECLKFANACAVIHIKKSENVFPTIREVESFSNRANTMI